MWALTEVAEISTCAAGIPAAAISSISRAFSPCGNTPLSTFIKVDLPAPFSPTTAWISPARTARVTSLSAVTP